MKRLLGPYAEVLRLPGALAFTSSGFLARLPISIEGLGIVLFITASRDSYALAGILTAIYALSASMTQPFTGRLADTWGQRVVLPILAVSHALALIGFVMAVNAGAAAAALAVISLLLGASQPSVGGMVRARWAYTVTSPAQVRTAFAIESLLDEVIYIVGPPLATFLALSVAGGAPLIASAVFVLAGSFPLVLQRRTEPPRTRHQGAREPMPRGALIVVIAGMICLGIVFGALEISFVAFADEAGQPGMTGVLYVAYSLASIIAGLWFGSRHFAAALSRQWQVTATALMIATFLLPWATSIPFLLAVSFVAGLAVSPTLIIGFTLVERTMPASRLTEALTWALAMIGVGIAAAAALAGALVQDHTARLGFWVCAAGGVLILAVTLVGGPILHRAETRTGALPLSDGTAD